MKFLFIGNSATYVHKVPQWLQQLAQKAGHIFEVAQITPGGYRLCQHADMETAHGQRVFAEIQKGYDVVFLQDNGNCILSEENRALCAEASKRLVDAIRESGARAWFYVRPPYGYPHEAYDPLAQCVEFDGLFGSLARELGAGCVYVNRAFAYAMEQLPFDLWGADHAHTSLHGAYLIVCTFFATLFGTSATCLDFGELDSGEALALQQVADRIALEQVIPWQR